MDIRRIYENARASYRLQPDDNPENLWFYAAFHAMREVCAVLCQDAKLLDHVLHQAICWSRGDFDVLLECLERERLVHTDKAPVRGYCGEHEPVWDDEKVEERAIEIFRAQFKTKWPEQRLGTRFAKAKWELVQFKAREMALNEFAASHDAWQKREDRRAVEFERRCAEWNEKATRVNAINAGIEAILREARVAST